MGIDSCILSKEEVKIIESGNFYIPIHPKLIDPNVSINPDLARNVFEKSAYEWYEDLIRHYDLVSDKTEKNFIKREFLDLFSGVSNKDGELCLLNGVWKNIFGLSDNGFADTLSISRNSRGSLYFNKIDSCEYFIPLNGMENRYFKIGKEKALEFCYDKFIDSPGKIYTYNKHNVENFPSALFLRNWALNYVNAALEDISKD